MIVCYVIKGDSRKHRDHYLAYVDRRGLGVVTHRQDGAMRLRSREHAERIILAVGGRAVTIVERAEQTGSVSSGSK